jgi:hypothetical protein
MCALTDGTKDSSYDELEGVFNNFSKFDVKMLSRDFSTKVGKEDILELKIGNEFTLN